MREHEFEGVWEGYMGKFGARKEKVGMLSLKYNLKINKKELKMCSNGSCKKIIIIKFPLAAGIQSSLGYYNCTNGTGKGCAGSHCASVSSKNIMSLSGSSVKTLNSVKLMAQLHLKYLFRDKGLVERPWCGSEHAMCPGHGR